MKTFFVINDNSPYHYDLLKASINSLKINTSLEPYCIYTGATDHPILTWLKNKGVPILNHSLSFIKNISAMQFEDFKLPSLYRELYQNHKHLHNNNLLITESVRIDLPVILQNHHINDEYVLYCDVDTLFLSEIDLSVYKPSLIGAVLRYKYLNNGVMLFNMPSYTKQYQAFKEFIIEKNFNFELFWGSQGAFNEYFIENIAPIPIEYNWHVFWGINSNTKIAHFCGLKPNDYMQIYKGNKTDYTPWFTNLAWNNKKQIEHYINLYEGYRE